MRRLLVLVLVLGATTFLGVPAYACLCGRLGPTPEESVRDADLVFLAEVTRPVSVKHWEVRVLAVAKGRVPRKVALLDSYAGTSCGSTMARLERDPAGGRFVYVGDADLDADTCGHRVWGPDALTELGLPTYPPYEERHAPGTPLVLVAVGLVALAGLRVVSARRNAAASAAGTASAG